MNSRKNNFAFLFLILIIVGVAIWAMRMPRAAAEKETYSAIRDLFEEEQVKSFTLADNTLTLTLRVPDENGNDKKVFQIASFSVFYEDFNELITRQYEDGILESYDYPAVSGTPWWIMFIPYVIIALLVLGVWLFMVNRMSGGAPGGDRTTMKFAKARTTVGISENDRVTFDDVAGADEEKAELQEVVDFLQNPEKYTRLGAKIPKGILLVGPPGTGKTLIAKAVAGEAGVQFLSISGSDFVELYVGVGASRVRDLFDQAKKSAPAIVFIDEIDAVGRQRGAGLGGGHDEREQTLNQLLVEMDGFNNNEGVIVMAATNRVDILDSALLRPGRFDRQIYVGTPDTRGREAILKVHSRNKPLSDDVQLGVIAKQTAGFTGADLQNLMNESALRAAKEGRPVITMEDIETSMIKVIAGPEKRSRVVPERERKLTAVHEAGHAIVMHKLPHHDPVHQITIVPRGMAGGMTISLPTEDHSYMSRNEMLEQIVSLLGGRVAESLMLDDISTGASNDIQRATSIAKQMITKYGMSQKLGPVSFDSDGQVFIGRDYGHTKSYSEEFAAHIDLEIQETLQNAYKVCEQILRDNMDQLQRVSDYLLEHETMSGETFREIMDGPESEIPETSDPSEE
ncbi:MAG: ATP-dependent zinc metalloprotease FtsH [Oscillospiraceae bacterium]|nr:ATP-dependent zinc metalloprotease FtsH [Oscillospiraceae bacterium]